MHDINKRKDNPHGAPLCRQSFIHHKNLTLILDGRDASHLYPIDIVGKFQRRHISKHGVTLRGKTALHFFKGSGSVRAQLETGGEFVLGQVGILIVSERKGKAVLSIVRFDAFCALRGKRRGSKRTTQTCETSLSPVVSTSLREGTTPDTRAKCTNFANATTRQLME